MARKFKLDDLHLILLSTATQRDDGGILPISEIIADQQDRIAKALPELLKHKLVDEVPATAKEAIWREEGEDRFALIINDTGRGAIGVNDDGGPAAEIPMNVEVADPVEQNAHRPASKSSAVVALLQREQGATLAEMIEATDWLPHTTRAALTGLRKKGHVIEKTKRDEVTCYRIAVTA
jgi:hypothetical protein